MTMTKQNIKTRYFNFIYRMMYKKKPGEPSYRKLFTRLHQIPFRWVIDRDENRNADGINLRYEFSVRYDLDYEEVKKHFDPDHCSVLEMMAALAIRCDRTHEQRILPENPIANWFWEMLMCMRLDEMTDTAYVEEYVDEVVANMLDRKYSKNGMGGLYCTRTDKDMREMEIFIQMNSFVQEFYPMFPF